MTMHSPFFLDKTSMVALLLEAPLHNVESPKKADVAEHPEVFHHVGLLVNGPPSVAELPFS
jgi:hypothetical protein